MRIAATRPPRTGSREGCLTTSHGAGPAGTSTGRTLPCWEGKPSGDGSWRAAQWLESPPGQRRGPPGLLAACWGLRSHRNRSSLLLGPGSATLRCEARAFRPSCPGAPPHPPPWPDKDERCLPAGLWGSPPGASLRHYRVVRETGELPPRNPLSGLATFQTEPERGGTSHPPSSALRPGLPRPGTMTAEARDSAALPEEGLPAEVTPCPFVGHRGKRVPYAAQSHVGRQDGRLQDPAQTGRGTQTPGGRARP